MAESANGPVRAKNCSLLARRIDDEFQLLVRVFDYNTQEQVAAFAAHSDFIQGLAVHPTASIALTGTWK